MLPRVIHKINLREQADNSQSQTHPSKGNRNHVSAFLPFNAQTHNSRPMSLEKKKKKVDI